MKATHLLLALFIFLFSQFTLADSGLGPGWQIIPVNSKLTIKGNDGKLLKIEPACAFDSLINPANGSTIDNSFHFYFKPGKNDKLVVFFNGGGACWDDATCLTSLKVGDRPTYNPSINQENSPIGAGGIFDDTNAANPFKDWSKVFIPYCTGDIHIGSKSVKYIDDGSYTGYQDAPVEIKHHGFDNFLAVREWIKGQFPIDREHNLKKLVVTGSSAGGYGATLNFPYLQDAFPKTNAVLVSDASSAVVTQGFIDTVFDPDGNWNLENTLHTIFAKDFQHHYSVDSFNATLIEKLTATYPKGRFAQYTTVFDVVQTQFLKIMTMIDAGSIDPALWGFTGATPEDQNIWFSWNWRMEESLDDINVHTKNYQYYMG
ncbi:MAG: pectinacetylesterase family protein, partial [Methylococcaceae bacterium]|nr:pectinacetylesterase family protein [Methylococcaceae bacterium]